MNLKEIFIWGIRRSGNHMMADFILDHRNYPEISNIEPSKKRQRVFRRNLVLLNDYFKDHHYQKDLTKKKSMMKGYPKFNERIPVPYPSTGNLQLISYEINPGISNQSYKNYIDIFENPDNLLVDTKREVSEKYAIIILRDPYNWLTSLSTDKKRQKNIDNFIQLWKETAEKFFIHKPNENYYPVNYNRFISDKEYRRKLSFYMNENFSDKGMNRVSSKGSSFDGNKFDGNAQNMPTKDRWKNMPDWLIKKISNDNELRKLSKEIFNFEPV